MDQLQRRVEPTLPVKLTARHVAYRYRLDTDSRAPLLSLVACHNNRKQFQITSKKLHLSATKKAPFAIVFSLTNCYRYWTRPELMVISELRFHPDNAESWHAGTFLGIVTCVDKDQVDLPLCAKRSCWYRL